MLEGVFVLPNSIYVDFECLDSSHEIVFAGITAQIIFPKLDGSSIRNSLKFISPNFNDDKPLQLFKKRFDYDETFWGSPETYTILENSPESGSGEVQAIRVCFPDLDSPFYAEDHLRTEFLEWWKLVEMWIEVLSGQVVAFGYSSVSEFRDLYLWDGVDSDSDYRYELGSRLEVNLHNQNPLTLKDLKQAFVNANETAKPADANIILHNAIAMKIKGNFRLSIIEAGTAAELALTRILKNYFQTLAPGLEQALLAKYKTLGQLGNLAEQLGIEIDKNFYNDLVKKRNSSIHDGELFTRNDASQAIEIASKLVIRAWPNWY